MTLETRNALSCILLRLSNETLLAVENIYLTGQARNTLSIPAMQNTICGQVLEKFTLYVHTQLRAFSQREIRAAVRGIFVVGSKCRSRPCPQRGG